jgi:protein TonB
MKQILVISFFLLLFCISPVHSKVSDNTFEVVLEKQKEKVVHFMRYLEKGSIDSAMMFLQPGYVKLDTKLTADLTAASGDIRKVKDSTHFTVGLRVYNEKYTEYRCLYYSGKNDYFRIDIRLRQDEPSSSIILLKIKGSDELEAGRKSKTKPSTIVPSPPPPPPPASSGSYDNSAIAKEEVTPVVKTQQDSMRKEEVVFSFAENQPEFPGGEEAMKKYLATNIHYPEREREENIGGVVYISFVVGKDGKIRSMEVLKGVKCCPHFGEEAIRVIHSMGAWKPALMNGKPVNCQYNLPVSYKLK